jgi:hypothetical protein
MKLSVLGLALVLLTGPVAASDLEDAFQNLKKAETKKDPVLVKKAATELFASADQVICAPTPQGDAEQRRETGAPGCRAARFSCTGGESFRQSLARSQPAELTAVAPNRSGSRERAAIRRLYSCSSF